MNKSEALEILGVSASATQEEINEKFRELAKEVHSDQGGSDEEFIKIDEARKKLMSEKGNSLVIKDEDFRSIVKQNYDINKEKLIREDIKDLTNRIKIRSTSKYREFKRYSIITGLAFGGISALSTQFENITPFLPGASSDIWTLSFAIMAIMVGAFYGTLNLSIHRIEGSIEAIKEILSDKQSFYQILELLEKESDEFNERYDDIKYTKEEWEELFEKFKKADSPTREISEFKRHVRRIANTDLINIFIKKGQQLGILKEFEIWKNGRPTFKYGLKNRSGS